MALINLWKTGSFLTFVINLNIAMVLIGLLGSLSLFGKFGKLKTKLFLKTALYPLKTVWTKWEVVQYTQEINDAFQCPLNTDQRGHKVSIGCLLVQGKSS